MFELFPYQQEIIDKIDKKYYEHKDNLFVQSPPRSGKTVVMAFLAKQITKQKKKVLFVVHIQEVLHAAQKTFKSVGVDMKLVDFYSPVKVTNRIKKEQFKENDYDLILIDEAHHSKAGSYMKIRQFFHPRHFLFFTATPIRQDGQGFEDISDDIVLGPTVKQLIEWGNLADFDYYTIPLNNENALKVGSSGDYTEQSITKSIKDVKPEDVFKQYKKYGDGKQGLIYCARVEKSKQITKYFNEHGIPSAHIGGDTPQEERQKYVEAYKKGDIKVISNVSVFTEGVDLPSAEIALLLRPTQSLSLYLQFAMRVLTQYHDKHAIIVDLVGTALKLGLPDYEHQWSLAPTCKNDSDFNEENRMRYCKECAKTFYIEDGKLEYIETVDDQMYYSLHCPYCGVITDDNITKKIVGQTVSELNEQYNNDAQLQKVKSREEFMRDVYKQRRLSVNRNFNENFLIAYVKNDYDKDKAFIDASHIQSELYSESSIRAVGEANNISESTLTKALSSYNASYQAMLMKMKYTYLLDSHKLLQKMILNAIVNNQQITVKQKMAVEFQKLKNSSLNSATNRKKFENMKLHSEIFKNYLDNLNSDNIDNRTIDLAMKLRIKFPRDINTDNIILTEEDLQNYKKISSFSNKNKDILKSMSDNANMVIMRVEDYLSRKGKLLIRVTLNYNGIPFYAFLYPQNPQELAWDSTASFIMEPQQWIIFKNRLPNRQMTTEELVSNLSVFVGHTFNCRIVSKEYRVVNILNAVN